MNLALGIYTTTTLVVTDFVLIEGSMRVCKILLMTQFYILLSNILEIILKVYSRDLLQHLYK